jgi:CelD/BcsL family acetyltransferase involved in cellulose biosynthesis
MSYTIVRDLPDACWREFVATHPAGNVFHTPEMFQVFAATDGHQPECWAAADGNQIQALLLPVRITVQGRLPKFFTTRAVGFGSVLCAPGKTGKQALADLLQAYRRSTGRGLLFTELRNLHELGDLHAILHQEGFHYQDYLDYLIDLSRPPEQIWKEVDKNVRTNVRKAQKLGVVVEEVNELAQIQDLYGVLSAVYKRIQVPLAPISLFESAFRLLSPKGMATFYVARLDGQAIAAAARLLYKDMIFAWYAGARSEYAQYKANDLLNWSIIEWGAQNGYRCFSFGGAGQPNQEYGPRVYKAKFNGDLVNYGRNTCVHAPLMLRLSKVGYNLLRKYVA